MSQPNTPTPITSTHPSPARASDELRSSLYDLLAAFTDTLDEVATEHEARIAALEAALAVTPQAGVVPFAESRRSWTVKQLADDLGVHENTVRNWIALSPDSPRHLDSFQPGGTGPHLILPEYVAAWIARNERDEAA